MSEDEFAVVPEAHGLSGMIACISDQAGRPGLMILDVSSGSSTALMSVDCSWRSVPAVAPGGDRVALQGADGRLKVVSVVTDQTESIGEPIPGLVTPSWSPGGDAIMYELDATVHVVSLSGTLSESDFAAANAAWMGDGSKTVFVADGALHAKDTWTGQTVKLTAGPDKIWGLAASRDGVHAAYVASDDDEALLRVVDVFTGETWEMRTSRGIWPWSLAWSPNGGSLAYCVGGPEARGGQRVSVWMLDARAIGADDGCEPNAIVTFVSDPRCAGLAWSPDSKAVATAARTGESGLYSVYAVDSAGGAHQLTSRGNCVLPDWGPSPI